MKMIAHLYINDKFVSNGIEFSKAWINIPNVGCFGVAINKSNGKFECQKHYYEKDITLFHPKWIKKTAKDIVYIVEIDTEKVYDSFNNKDVKINELYGKFKNPIKNSFYKFNKTKHIHSDVFNDIYNLLSDLQGMNEHWFCETASENVQDEWFVPNKEMFREIGTEEMMECADFYKTSENKDKQYISKRGNTYRINGVTKLLEIKRKSKTDCAEPTEMISKKDIRKVIFMAKIINNTGLKLVKNNFYQFTENPNNSNYIVIDGININKNRVEFIEVYKTPPVSNANA
jgi:hypothetical protein